MEIMNQTTVDGQLLKNKPTTNGFTAQEMLSHAANLKRYAHRLHRTNEDDAQELVQETYTKAWAARTSFKEGTNLQGFLLRIMHNFYLQTIKRWSSSKIIYWPSFYDMVSELEDPYEQADTVALINDIIKSFAALSAEHKAILKASIEGKDYFEMAKEFGIERGTVASRINRARQKMRENILGDHASI